MLTTPRTVGTVVTVMQSYLREALEEIAHLNKRGPYALKWSLKPHYLQSLEGQTGLGPDGKASGADLPTVKAEPGNDDVKMEDVS